MENTHAVFLALAALASCSKASEHRPQSPPPSPPSSSTSRVQADAYTVELLPPAASEKGPALTATVSLTAGKGYHVNVEYPMAFAPQANDSLHFETSRVALSGSLKLVPCDGSPQDSCAATAAIPFSVQGALPAPLSGVLSFSVCKPEQCLREKVSLSSTVVARTRSQSSPSD